MAWVATNFNGTETISPDKPIRDFREWACYKDVEIESEHGEMDFTIPLPKGTIRKLIGKELTWKDDPVELIKSPNQFGKEANNESESKGHW